MELVTITTVCLLLMAASELAATEKYLKKWAFHGRMLVVRLLMFIP